MSTAFYKKIIYSTDRIPFDYNDVELFSPANILNDPDNIALRIHCLSAGMLYYFCEEEDFQKGKLNIFLQDILRARRQNASSQDIEQAIDHIYIRLFELTKENENKQFEIKRQRFCEYMLKQEERANEIRKEYLYIESKMPKGLSEIQRVLDELMLFLKEENISSEEAGNLLLADLRQMNKSTRLINKIKIIKR